MSTSYAEPVLAWYARHARDLPWRAPGATPWAVLVSEIMLQQTPVARVLPEYRKWIARWPTPAALAAEPAGEAIRQWGRLGYPRRALRLHETAVILAGRHGGMVPADLDALLALPGIGGYTAAAVASFAFGQRHAVLDTNVRRVLSRLIAGTPLPAAASSAASVAERRLAESLLPAEPAVAARWSVAVMELGALVCTAASPRCGTCPVARECAWLAAGRPAGPAGAARRRTQRYDGTDRQCRGRLMAVLRAAGEPVSRAAFDAAWPGQAQLARALDGLVADGLVDPLPDGRFALPGARVLAPPGSVPAPHASDPAPHASDPAPPGSVPAPRGPRLPARCSLPDRTRRPPSRTSRRASRGHGIHHWSQQHHQSRISRQRDGSRSALRDLGSDLSHTSTTSTAEQVPRARRNAMKPRFDVVLTRWKSSFISFVRAGSGSQCAHRHQRAQGHHPCQAGGRHGPGPAGPVVLTEGSGPRPGSAVACHVPIRATGGDPPGATPGSSSPGQWRHWRGCCYPVGALPVSQGVLYLAEQQLDVSQLVPAA